MPESGNPRKVFVIDTSVLLSDPKAFTRFEGNEVVIPIVVITELESKRHDPELGYFARAALRHLDALRVSAGSLAQNISVNNLGGSLRVELNHVDQTVLPAGFRLGDNDSRILAVAKSLATNHVSDTDHRYAQVTVVSKDLPMRIKASAIGLKADEYRGQLVNDSGWTGTSELEITRDEMDALYAHEGIWIGDSDQPVNTCFKLTAPGSHGMGRLCGDGMLHMIDGSREVYGVRGRSFEQRAAIDLLTDPDVGIVSMGGRAGTGKSALAICAGLEAMLELRAHKKVIVFRPLYSVGGQDLGFLPGSEAEKMNPWAQAVFDTMGEMVSRETMSEVLERGQLEVLPLTHIRGRTLADTWVIVDEAQSLERNVLLTVMSRIGKNSKIILTHDVAQRDNLHVGRHDGVAAVVEKLKGHRLFGHVTLLKSERSEIAEMVTDMLEEVE